ncbi:MAG: VanW family protein [Oscillospiraceae bacterium]|jgi:vancomycin resistance protein VanW|nr:VanW family protein [Oscillospiraceae bacterium]
MENSLEEQQEPGEASKPQAGRRLFCEISPVTYRISQRKEQCKRTLRDLRRRERFAKTRADQPLPALIYRHSSLIRRRLGQVDMTLQENKAVNLSLAAPKLSGILLQPGETFSFWRLAGGSTAAKGYREGLTITNGRAVPGMGGGLCQFTNLLHWLVLHSPLEIVEHHHHDRFDLFPDFGRAVPFGCGTSIMYNYLDYRVKNNTEQCFQFIAYVTETHLCGELRAEQALAQSYHILEKDAHFVRCGKDYYRRNKIFRQTIDKASGNTLSYVQLRAANARVMYDPQLIDPALLREE